MERKKTATKKVVKEIKSEEIIPEIIPEEITEDKVEEKVEDKVEETKPEPKPEVKAEIDPDEVVLKWRKDGGGSCWLKLWGKTKIAKPGEIFEARSKDIPVAFKDVIVCLDETELRVIEKKKADRFVEKKPVFGKIKSSPGWYNIINLVTKKKMNPKAVRGAEKADEIVASLNR